jgi:hypothetical protein
MTSPHKLIWSSEGLLRNGIMGARVYKASDGVLEAELILRDEDTLLLLLS